MNEQKHKSSDTVITGGISDVVFLRIIELARLDPLAPSMAIHKEELRKILDHFSVLAQIDISDVEQTIHINPVALPLMPDEPEDYLTRDAAMSNARLRTSEYFQAPKILEADDSGGK